MSLFRLLLPILLVLFASSSLDAQPVGHDFTPRTGFGGLSTGRGTLKFLFGKPRPYHVHSRGYPTAGGAFRLDQTVTFEGEKPRHRFWIITSPDRNTYRGSLSDAAGTVSGHTEGNRLFLRYRIKGPLVMHQTLKLMGDGTTIDNVGKITLLGITVGHLHETIVRSAHAGGH